MHNLKKDANHFHAWIFHPFIRICYKKILICKYLLLHRWIVDLKMIRFGKKIHMYYHIVWVLLSKPKGYKGWGETVIVHLRSECNAYSITLSFLRNSPKLRWHFLLVNDTNNTAPNNTQYFLWPAVSTEKFNQISVFRAEF